MSAPIKFSFLILAWNRSRMLQMCLQSLVSSIQHLHNSEIIVMDNGSTDDTPQLLKDYSGQPGFTIYTLPSNFGIRSYKNLISKAKGEYLVIIDEDVIEFPKAIDAVFARYMSCFTDYAMLSLDVVQNEYTNGGKPGPENYTVDQRNGLMVSRGPAGGWCACFRRRDYQKVRLLFNLLKLSMRRSHDTTLAFLFRNILHKKHGIVTGVNCLHASGPIYAQQFGYLKMQQKKYVDAGLTGIADTYAAPSEH